MYYVSKIYDSFTGEEFESYSTRKRSNSIYVDINDFETKKLYAVCRLGFCSSYNPMGYCSYNGDVIVINKKLLKLLSYITIARGSLPNNISICGIYPVDDYGLFWRGSLNSILKTRVTYDIIDLMLIISKCYPDTDILNLPYVSITSLGSSQSSFAYKFSKNLAADFMKYRLYRGVV